MVRLILVRHGQTHSNVGHHLDTAEPGADLTDLGRAQADALVEMLGDAGIGALYASTLVRTQQTAAPLARALELPVQVRREIREIGAGSLEMSSHHEDVQTYLRIALGWIDGDLSTRMPDGEEDGAQTLARFDGVVAEAAESGAEVAALVTHGAMIRVWVAARARNANARDVAYAPVSNTGAAVLVGEPGEWHVERWHEPALGGPELADPTSDGAAADVVESPEAVAGVQEAAPPAR